MWDGVFLPKMKKHRDYQHNGNVAAHLLEQGIAVPGEPVRVKQNPINQEALSQARPYQKVDLDIHDRTYTFLIPISAAGYDKLTEIIAEGLAPELMVEEEFLEQELNRYFENQVEGGRDWREYVDELDQLEELINGLDLSL